VRKVRIFVALCVLLSGAAHAVEREFEAHPGELITFNLRTGGTIKITGWELDKVSIAAEVGGEDADIVDLSLKKTKKGVLVESEYTAARQTIHSRVILLVKVPSVFDVKVNSSGGSITIDGVDGNLSGETLGGSLTLTDLKGSIDFSTMGGHISLTGSDVDGRVSTLGGEAVIEGVVGDVEIECNGCTVVCRQVTRRDGSSACE
jgi:DUF4097 and DUF4098 domain-containing protein YvlB